MAVTKTVGSIYKILQSCTRLGSITFPYFASHRRYDFLCSLAYTVVLWLLPVLMSVVSNLLGPRDVKSMNASLVLSSSETARGWNGTFEERRRRWHAEIRGHDARKRALTSAARRRN